MTFFNFLLAPPALRIASSKLPLPPPPDDFAFFFFLTTGAGAEGAVGATDVDAVRAGHAGGRPKSYGRRGDGILH